MDARRRQGRILQLMSSGPRASYASIARRLSAPIDTIRSDLAELEGEGVVRRGRGRAEIIRQDLAQDILESSGALSRSERQRRLLRLVSAGGESRVGELALRFGVSPGTIRSDLVHLQRSGRIARTHGGVRAILEPAEELVRLEADETAGPGLASICRRAAEHVEDADVVFLDGTRVGARIAAELPAERRATVVTNNLRAACVLARREYRGEVFVLPGLLLPRELATDLRFHTALTERIRITKAFLGARSFDARRGLLFDSQVHLNVFAAVSELAEGVYVLLESRSLGESGVYGAPLEGRLSTLRELIVDDGLDADRAAALFPSDYPVVICGDNYVLTSPFHRQYVIGFACLFGGYEFSQIVRQSIEEAAKAYSNVDLLLTDNRMESSVTMANVDTFIDRKVDLVIEYQHDYALGPLISEKLSHAGIPVIAVDIPVPGAVYFGVNNYRAGLLAGEEAAKAIAQRWGGRVDEVIALTAPAAGPIPGNRVVGMLEALLARVPFPEDRVLKVSTANSPEASARAISSVLLSIGPERRAMVLAFNDVVCAGVLEALRRLDRSANTMVVSHSHVPSISRELGRPGSPLIGSVAYHPESYGPRILELAMRMLRRESVSPNNYMEHQWMTS